MLIAIPKLVKSFSERTETTVKEGALQEDTGVFLHIFCSNISFLTIKRLKYMYS